MSSSIDSDSFSASDLSLFIDSIEKITDMERKKMQRRQQRQARHLAKTLKYMDDQKKSGNGSTTLSSTTDAKCLSRLEPVDEEEISYDYAGQSELDNHSSDEEQNVDYDSTSLEQNEYYEIEDKSRSATSYTKPVDCLESTKISTSTQSMSSASGVYEDISPIKSVSGNTISATIYREPVDRRQITKAPSASSVEYEQIPSMKSVKAKVTIPTNTSEDSKGSTKKKSLKKCFLGLVRRNYRKHFSFNSNIWSKSNSWMELTVAWEVWSFKRQRELTASEELNSTKVCIVALVSSTVGKDNESDWKFMKN